MPSPSSVNNERALRFARAALLALESGTGATRATERDAVVILPELTPLPWHTAAERLASAAKPLALIGLAIDGRLHIGYWDAARDMQELAVEMIADMLSGALVPSCPAGVADVRLLSCVDGVDGVEMTSTEFLAWVAEYCFPLSSMEVSPSEPSVSASCRFIARIGPRAQGFLSSI